MSHRLIRKTVWLACFACMPALTQPMPSVPAQPLPETSDSNEKTAPAKDSTKFAAILDESQYVPDNKLTTLTLISLGTTALLGIGSGIIVANAKDAGNEQDGVRHLTLPIFIGSLVLGPSIGQFYLGDDGAAGKGILIRGLGGTLFLFASACYKCSSANALGIVGIITYSYGVYYSLHQPWTSHGPPSIEATSPIELFPTVVRNENGDYNPGMMVRAKF